MSCWMLAALAVGTRSLLKRYLPILPQHQNTEPKRARVMVENGSGDNCQSKNKFFEFL